MAKQSLYLMLHRENEAGNEFFGKIDFKRNVVSMIFFLQKNVLTTITVHQSQIYLTAFGFFQILPDRGFVLSPIAILGSGRLSSPSS